MNVPIFFFSYLIGYLLCAYVMEMGIKIIEDMPSQQGWSYRSTLDWRLYMRFGRVAIAIWALAWPYTLMVAIVLRMTRKEDSPPNPEWARACRDALGWCYVCPCSVHVATVPRCEDTMKIRDVGPFLIEEVPRCMFPFFTDRGKCFCECEWREMNVNALRIALWE